MKPRNRTEFLWAFYLPLLGVGFYFLMLFFLPYKFRLYNALQIHFIENTIKYVELVLIYALPPFLLMILTRLKFHWGLRSTAILVIYVIVAGYLISGRAFLRFTNFIIPVVIGILGIIAGVIVRKCHELTFSKSIISLLYVSPLVVLTIGSVLFYSANVTSFSQRIRNDIQEFEIPIYPQAYDIVEHEAGKGPFKHLQYKVDVTFPDTSVLGFYAEYLLEKNWQLMEDSGSWDTYGVAIKGRERWIRSSRRSWVDENKEKVFFINITYETPIGVKDDNQVWAEEWLATQEVFIRLVDYQSYMK